jgi:SPP1 family predicted phage head-tail adaptor
VDKIRVKNRGARIGDMIHYILIHTRDITVPAFGSIDFSENFTGVTSWASIATPRGKTVFDDVGQEIDVTHVLRIRYDVAVTNQTYIQLEDGRRLKILAVENLDENNWYIEIKASDRGLNEAAKA